MNIWHNISPKRIKKNRFYAVIEISKGGKNKYELDKETGMLKLDRVLFTSTHYPANYGFIPRTYANDNDPLDVLVLCSEEILPMTIVECSPIGVLIMEDGGSRDEKSLQCPLTTRTTIAIKTLTSFHLTAWMRLSISLRFTKHLKKARPPQLSKFKTAKRQRALFKPA